MFSFILLYTGSTVEPYYFARVHKKCIAIGNLTDIYDHSNTKGDCLFTEFDLEKCKQEKQYEKVSTYFDIIIAVIASGEIRSWL